MKMFSCPNCTSPVFFENTSCENCKKAIGYDAITNGFAMPYQQHLSITRKLKFCSNFDLGVCNWLIDEHNESQFCISCQTNRKVPNIQDSENFGKWQKLEFAKHRLFYQLQQLKLPIVSKLKDHNGLTFDFLSADNEEKAVTGHADGVITILLTEADSVAREQLRKKMEEPYRTLLGHFRHEIGHYYWMSLFDDTTLQDFRNVFGDESLDYGDSLETHYKVGAPLNWNENYISKYASSHPWEDWAETWAHYLHIMDTLETASANNLAFSVSVDKNEPKIEECLNPYEIAEFGKIFKSNTTLTIAVNSLNRSMGIPDIYPFVVPEAVVVKLEFIHNLLRKHR